VIIPNGEYVSATCLHKVVITESSMDTNATARHIRECMSGHSTYMVTVDSDIGMFNLYVNGPYEQQPQQRLHFLSVGAAGPAAATEAPFPVCKATNKKKNKLASNPSGCSMLPPLASPRSRLSPARKDPGPGAPSTRPGDVTTKPPA
jgi:hypothetical protein